MNLRTCVVDRQEKDPEDLIRFVCGPDNAVYPDLKHKLPGRGVWVSNSRTKVSEAISKGHFARGFKAKVEVDQNLVETIEGLMEKDCLALLSLAKKAGVAISGFSKVEVLVRTGQAYALVHSAEASQDGVGKLAQAARVTELDDMPVISDFSGEKLDAALGLGNATHIGLTESKLAKSFVRASARYRSFLTN